MHIWVQKSASVQLQTSSLKLAAQPAISCTCTSHLALSGRMRLFVLLVLLLEVLLVVFVLLIEEAYVAMNFVHHLMNFRKLVCGCMDSYDSEQSHILQHFSSSTR